jgi:hypothetical protein
VTAKIIRLEIKCLRLHVDTYGYMRVAVSCLTSIMGHKKLT